MVEVVPGSDCCGCRAKWQEHGMTGIMKKGFRHDLLISFRSGMPRLDQGKKGQCMVILMMRDQYAGLVHDGEIVIVIISDSPGLLKKSDHLVKMAFGKFDIGHIVQDRWLAGGHFQEQASTRPPPSQDSLS